MINVISVSESMIHFSEKSWDLNFTDRFLKCRNYHILQTDRVVKK
ncbi:hypothetical protein LEP1GSC170_4168 [Leptospira interrogans serovar Bataviae str. HAI135]|nr:hypothetical protein LEP1GSC170_4168 [Leptospira interrogans serovar Bataviae str. HAI135]